MRKLHSTHNHDASGNLSTIEKYDASGNLSTIEKYDASGKLSTIEKYDAFSRLESKEEYQYDASGKLITIRKYKLGRLKQIEEYDASGNLSTIEKYGLLGGLNHIEEYYTSGEIKTKKELDYKGKILQQTEYWTEDSVEKSVEIYASYLKKKEEIIENQIIKILAIYIITLAALIIPILLFHIPMLYVAAGISSLFLLRKLWYKITGLFRSEKQQYKTKRTLAYLVLVALTSLAAGLAIRFKVGFTRNMDKLHKVLYSIIFIAAAVMVLRIMFFLEIFGPNPKYEIATATELGIRSHGPKPPGFPSWHIKQSVNRILDEARSGKVTSFSNSTKTSHELGVLFFSAGYSLINKESSSATITHYHPAVDKAFNNRKEPFDFTEIPGRTTKESLLLCWLSSRSAR